MVATTVPESGIGLSNVSEDGDRVELLVVVDSQTRNVKVTNRQTLGLTVVMVRGNGEWLIEDLQVRLRCLLSGGARFMIVGSDRVHRSVQPTELTPRA